MILKSETRIFSFDAEILFQNFNFNDGFNNNSSNENLKNKYKSLSIKAINCYSL